MTRHPALLAAFALLALVPPARADDMMEFVSQYRPSFATHWLDVHLVGNRALVPGASGLSVFDITTPNAPVFLGRYQQPLGGIQFYHATPSTPLTYTAARDNGIFVLNVANAPPTLVATHDEGTRSFEGLLLDGTLLYVATHDDGLRIYNVSNPSNLTLTGSLGGFANAWAVDKQGSTVVVADAEGGLKVVDVSNPAAPALLATAATSGAAQDVVWKGNEAYVACGGNGVDIFDLTTPAAPVLRGNYATDSSAFLLAADPAAARVYVATWDIVDVIDVGDPAHPVRAGFEDTPTRAMGVAASATHVFVADWDTFRVYRFGPTTQPDLSVTPSILSFPAVPIGQSADSTVTIANTGGATLNVTNIVTGNAEFHVAPSTFQVPPGGQVDVTLTVTPIAAKGYGNLRVACNDPDENGLDHLIDYGTVGTVAIDFTLNDLNGSPYTLSSHRGEIILMAFFASW